MKNRLSFCLVLLTIACQNAFAAIEKQTASLSSTADSILLPARQEGVAIRKGTSILLRLAEPVKSSETQEGNVVKLEVEGDLIVNGNVIAAHGMAAFGKIVRVKKPGIFGKGAIVEIVPTLLQTVDGRKIQLRGKALTKKGKDKQMLAFSASTLIPVVGVALLNPPFALIPFVAAGVFVRGAHVEISAGEVLEAVIAENVLIKA